MTLLNCPICGMDRPEIEFRNMGEAHIARPGPEASDDDMASFLYLRGNPKGLIAERWRHVHGCGRFFNAVRNDGFSASVSLRALIMRLPMAGSSAQNGTNPQRSNWIRRSSSLRITGRFCVGAAL